jgi:hypothetical protein
LHEERLRTILQQCPPLPLPVALAVVHQVPTLYPDGIIAIGSTALGALMGIFLFIMREKTNIS